MEVPTGSSMAGAAKVSAVLVRPPLCERPSTHRVRLSELMEWRDGARLKASSLAAKKKKHPVQNSRLRPGLEELVMELDLFLDDAVQGSWKQQRHPERVELQLRASLEELRQGWTDRIDKCRPIQYIVGCARWRDLLLTVQEGVLIPRIKSEQFVDIVKAVLVKDESLKYGTWADLGTGSGALAIGLSRLLGKSGTVVAVDSEDVPLAVARANVWRCGVEDMVKVLKGSWFSPFAGEQGRLVGILSNPPYVPSASVSHLHEPLRAMDGGMDGMEHLVHLCEGEALALRKQGFLVLETYDAAQAHYVANYLVESKLFGAVTVLKDYAGIDRFVTAYRC